MIDASFDFTICGVPDEETVRLITQAIQRVLLDEFGTEIYIYPTMEVGTNG